MTVDETRLQALNDRDLAPGKYVLYWMQQSQRDEHNPALDVAIRKANALKLPVVVGFGLTDDYPDANVRHYRFMLEGLQVVQAALEKKGIRLVVRYGAPPQVAADLAERAALMVCDVGYTRHQRQWRQTAAAEARCPVVQVEGDVVVPVTEASAKAEYAARTLRPRIQKHLPAYLKLSRAVKPRRASLGMRIRGMDLSNIHRVLARMQIDAGVPAVSLFFKGGTTEAKKRLRRFIRYSLGYYDAHGNQPQTDDISRMSPYLHFGQISPVYLALQIQRTGEGQGIDRAAYLEQLIVRREMAMNYVYYTPGYDAFSSLPAWARKTLQDHARDTREYNYSMEELETARTHDPYWNAAMREMTHTGFMHNYMRMYWGKKILEWTADPETAFATTLALNNKYFLDGRDPNSYAGVAWIYGLHDRAWAERPIFGKVRYMAASGLERKCDIQAYGRKVDRLVAKKTASKRR